MTTGWNRIGTLALVAATAVATAAQARCGPGTWLPDPGISPAVLAASGYRVVTRQTLTLADGRRAIETMAANGPRRARCRTVYNADGTVAATTCALPCRGG